MQSYEGTPEWRIDLLSPFSWSLVVRTASDKISKHETMEKTTESPKLITY
jgi:hypothetical protein